MSEWVNLTVAVKELGISRDTIKSAIHNGRIPFRMSGTQFKINVKLARAYFAREDIENMKRVKRKIDAMPLSRRKANVRQVCV